MIIEVKPGEGGEDAAIFAEEIAGALVKALDKEGLTPVKVGTTVTVSSIPSWL